MFAEGLHLALLLFCCGGASPVSLFFLSQAGAGAPGPFLTADPLYQRKSGLYSQKTGKTVNFEAIFSVQDVNTTLKNDEKGLFRQGRNPHEASSASRISGGGMGSFQNEPPAPFQS
jgi:hypothetical protein